jgi:hypothetical protein
VPVAGVIDPSHNERKVDKSGRLPQWFSKDQVLSAALHADPKWSPWTYELLAAALEEFQERGDQISTTSLVAPCPRSLVLERKAPYILHMDDVWRAFRGTMIHYVLEGTARTNSIAEHRFFAPFDAEEITCSPDLVTSDTIYDYKNTKQVPKYDYPYRSHVEQLQLNRYILNHATRVEKDGEVATQFPFDYRIANYQHLVVVYIDLDGPKPLEVTHSVEVKGRTRKRREPHIWTDGEVLEAFIPRFRSLRAALDSYPEWPDGIEDIEWWGSNPDPKDPWKCPGFPSCRLKGLCLASKRPNGLLW